MYSWENSCMDVYKQLEDNTNWKQCPTCNEFPRLWIFNNGSHARCRCNHKWDAAPAIAESIMSFYKRTGGTDYDRNKLRDDWNLYCETGIPQNKLEEGRW